jgi:hypothetical protein
MDAVIPLYESSTPATLEPASESRSAPFWPFILFLMVVGAVAVLALMPDATSSADQQMRLFQEAWLYS